jgi:hypothetical protein
LIASCLLLTVITAEYGIRLLKGMLQDGGTVLLRRASLNSVRDVRYGWFSPRSEVIRYERPCYGTIVATYDPNGMRRIKEPAGDAEARVCVLGDSVTQAYQISDGDIYVHRLERRLRGRGFAVELFPAAVNGFGTLQQLMLYEDYCKPLEPDLILWQLTGNDLVNNSYEYERYGGMDNNLRRRPYWEDGVIRYRDPMWIPEVADSIALRIVNGVLLRVLPGRRGEEGLRQLGERATAQLVRRFRSEVEAPILAFEAGDPAVMRGIFSPAVAEWIEWPRLDVRSETCAHVGDHHPNAAGHARIAEALQPALERWLERIRAATTRAALRGPQSPTPRRRATGRGRRPTARQRRSARPGWRRRGTEH